jgi:hypothetical protein
MRSKNELKNELLSIKKELDVLKVKEDEIKLLMSEKAKTDDTNSGLFTLLKYMMEESKTTKLILQQLANQISEIHADTTGLGELPVEELQDQPSNLGAKVVPVSDLDKRILQYIQSKDMACADDVKKAMNYKGRNAASARLNRLHKSGLIERYQLGHKVYYKYDAGKATANTLIVSPPQ